MKKINYKYQLERLREICGDFHYDKSLGNAFTEYDKGHQKASVSLINDFIKLVDKALKGKL